MDNQFSPATYLLFEIWESFKLFWPVFLLAAVISLFVFLWSRAEAKSEQPSFLLIFSFSLLGICIGVLTGWSRSPIVGTTVTSILGLIGGLVVYLLGKREYPRITASSCIVLLSFFLLVGTYLGGKLRKIEMDFEREYERWLLDYKSILQDNNARYAAELEVWKKEGLKGIDKRNKTSEQSK